MWTVDVVRPDGAVVELFARGDRGPASALSAVYDLAREALIVNALTRVGVPTPAFVAYEPQATVLLLERARGRSDFTAIPDAARRQRIARHFIEVIAALHSVDVDSLGLDELGIPRTADALALQELVIGERLFDASGCEPEPIVTLSQEWLYANVPRQDIAPCFLQGDTGPGNFMFEGDRVTYLVDWEIAQAYRRWRVDYPDDWEDRLRRRWIDDLWAADRDTLLFVGNQHQHPAGFLILGVFWPPNAPLQGQLTLG